MAAYVFQRLGQAVLIAFIISLVAFGLLFAAKDPARALSSPDATGEQIEALRKRLGLDAPLPVQYGRWLFNLLKGDLGNSLYSGQPVKRLLSDRIIASAQLAAAALLITLIVGVPLGVLAAINRGKAVDTISTAIAVSGQAMPIFWLGLMLIIFFGVRLSWLPISGRGTWRHLVLPAVTLGYSVLPLTMRLTRSSMLEVLGQDYIRTARAKGIARRHIYAKHAFRNAATPVILALGLQFGALLGGAVVTETVFAWPGIGELAVIAVTTADLPVVQAIVLFAAGVVIFSNLLADIVVGFTDPRIVY